MKTKISNICECGCSQGRHGIQGCFICDCLEFKLQSKIQCPDCKSLGGVHTKECKMFKPREFLSGIHTQTPEEEKEQSIFTTLRIKRIVMDELRIYKANGLFITYDDALEFLLKKENINERRKNEI